MRIKIKDKNNMDDFLKSAKKLNKLRTEVGYTNSNKYADIAAVQEFGARISVTDKMRGYLAATGLPLKATTQQIVIPERSFLRTGAKESEKEIRKVADKKVVKALTGSIKPTRFMEELGEELKKGIQETAADLKNPKLHPYTVEQKGNAKPLKDTGKLLEAIEVIVK